MHRARLTLLHTLLTEVQAGTWKPTGTTLGHLSAAKLLPHGTTFDLDHWARETETGCGFAACAIGHACLDKRFNDQGLCLFWRQGGKTPIYLACHEEWEAVTEFFDLDYEDAKRLFSPMCYAQYESNRPAAVLTRLEALLARRDLE